jgi:hypothetical protein
MRREREQRRQSQAGRAEQVREMIVEHRQFLAGCRRTGVMSRDTMLQQLDTVDSVFHVSSRGLVEKATNAFNDDGSIAADTAQQRLFSATWRKGECRISGVSAPPGVDETVEPPPPVAAFTDPRMEEEVARLRLEPQTKWADVFPDDLPVGLPPSRGAPHVIDLVPGARPVSRPLNRRHTGAHTQYQVQWKGWPLEDASWLKLTDLGFAKEAIADYKAQRARGT